MAFAAQAWCACKGCPHPEYNCACRCPICKGWTPPASVTFTVDGKPPWVATLEARLARLEAQLARIAEGLES